MDPEILVWHGLDNMQVAGQVKHKWDKTIPSERPAEILVDVIGWGAGVVDRLRELGLPVRGINVAESASMAGTYVRLRDELWFKGREWLEKKDCKLPRPTRDREDPKEKLAQELVAVRYLPPTSTGKFMVEPKEETKKRLKRSPNIADAFLLTLASDAATLIHGSSYSTSWNQELKRNLGSVV